MNIQKIRHRVPCYLKIYQRRFYAVQTPGAPTIQVFNRCTKWQQRERAARNVEASRQVDYLRDEVASRLCERILDIKRHFPRVLDVGANACNIARILAEKSFPDTNTAEKTSENSSVQVKSRIGQIVAADSSSAFLHRDSELPFNDKIDISRQVIQDEESLPYDPNTFDAVLSSLSLHWINDLPSVLSQINSILKPDSPFVASMLGGDSLYELRTSLQLAELDRRGGVATHTSPLADVRDVGGLLQRAGFQLLTVDIDDIVVNFPTVFALMNDLKAMGEQNAVASREAAPIRRSVLAAAEAIYRELHGDEDGTLPATFRIIHMIGWKSAPNQAKPLQRGSGVVSIKDVLEGKVSSGIPDKE